MNHWIAVTLVAGALLAGPLRAEEQKLYGTPRQAAEAMIAACLSHDRALLTELLGPGASELFNEADPQAEREQLKTVGLAAAERMSFHPEDDGSVTWLVGDEAWPFPIPLVKEGSLWRFDTDAGKEEILARRIGRDELNAMAMLGALARAQKAYRAADHDGDRVLEYAASIVSTPGRHDGLYWVADPDPSPLAEYLGQFQDYLVGKDAGSGWYGYRFKILTGQAASAPGGARDYRVGGNLTGGFAIVAWPVEYGNSGVMTFQMSDAGTIYQKDLGAESAQIVREMTAFDPGRGWMMITTP